MPDLQAIPVVCGDACPERASDCMRVARRATPDARPTYRLLGYSWEGMLGRLGIVVAVLAVGLTPASASAAPRDVASTHAYLVAGYAALHATVSKWSAVEASIRKLDERFHAECPEVGAGSLQSAEEQKLAYETAGALWATGYHTDRKIVQAFVRAVGPLRWSNPTIDRSARRFTKGLREMTVLPVPDLCGDVRAWSAGGFKAVPASTEQYVRRVEAIDVKEIPRGLLAPYVQPADRGLRARVERLATQFEELEFSRGQDDWNTLLETLALSQ